ncbi:MAG: DUF2064 domain-containing protein [Planctomycetes bacterium]|nr:DUF2064 domain-containing protein [Planctomycetota bacterium]MCH9723477.1 DUF2064 domain-containing protein [Planctomycetota bacterium]MCH9775270.1 DUF2064 domain-containing protein [Planctomycetota bacterium]MCH9790024.1 DUF2064 domain-containing protein [Planctomycetota bacterium]
MVPRQGAIAIFVKTPGYSPLKTRLAESIGQFQAEQFHQHSAKAVEAVVRVVSEQGPVAPFWAVAEEAARSDPLWKQFPAISQGTGDLGSRLSHVNQTLSAKYDYVIFLGADAPQLSVKFLEKAVEHLSEITDRPRFVIGSASDGGFYLFGSQICLTREAWLNVPYSDSNTVEKLREQIQDRGEILELPVLTDVDTVHELETIQRQVDVVDSLLPEQLEVFEWIQKLDIQYP